MKPMTEVLNDQAVSRNLIILLVVAIVVVVIVIGLFIFLGQSGGSNVPRINATVETAGNTVYIYHDGGDPVQKDRITVRINGQDVSPDAVSLLHAQDWPWTAGKTLKVDFGGPGIPFSVDIIFGSGSSSTLIFSQRIATATTAPPTPRQTVTPPPARTTVVPEILIPVETLLPLSPSTPATTSPGISGPPLADFTASPRSGQVPLPVAFSDRSAGTPSSWLWSFGDGETSAARSPSHTYTRPGRYTVTLTVSNNLGSNKKTVTDYIMTGSAPVSAFTAVPQAGDAPLEVQFQDLSTGQPSSWAWNFGDGGTSAEQNPTHVYGKPGTYTVSLTTGNLYGENTRIVPGSITTSQAPVYDIYLTGSTAGTLSADGYLQFTVTTPDSWIKIAGKVYTFRTDDEVQLIVGDPSSGLIDGTGHDLSAFNFNLVRMFVNSEPAASGIVSDTRITGYKNVRSTLTLTIPPADTGTVMFVNTGKIARPAGSTITIRNFKPDSAGRMDFQKKTAEVYYKGGAEQYTVA